MAEETSPNQPVRNQNPLIAFLIFIIVIGLLALAFFFGLKYRQAPGEVTPTPTPEVTNIPSPQVTPTPGEVTTTPTVQSTVTPTVTPTPTITPTPTLTPTPTPTIKFELWKNLYKKILPTPTP
jgi:cytoskeletal protein RodZ